MKQSGHLDTSEKTGTGCPLLQSMEGDLQISMEVWVDNNNNNIIILHIVYIYMYIFIYIYIYIYIYVCSAEASFTPPPEDDEQWIGAMQ